MYVLVFDCTVWKLNHFSVIQITQNSQNLVGRKITKFPLCVTDWKDQTNLQILSFLNFFEKFLNFHLTYNTFTEWPKLKFPFSSGCNSETMHVSPYIGKAEMRLRGGSFFENLFTFFSSLFTIFPNKKDFHLSNTFWLYQCRVRTQKCIVLDLQIFERELWFQSPGP